MSKETRKKALIIAISEYNDNHLRPLEFCKNDGERMYDLLVSLGFEISDNHKLIGYTQFDSMRRAIYDFFNNRKTKADDTLLFYYSGHGIPVSDGNILASSETDYYSPRQMGFSSYELTNLIQDSNSLRIVEVLDCCYSGAARIGKGSEEDAAKLGVTAIENNAKLLQQGEGKCLLAASQAAQEAFGLREKGHSIFTYYLLEGLKGNKKSVDSEGNVTPDSLGNYVYKEILNLPPDKRPKQKPIRKTEASGEIILATYPELKPARIEVILTSLLKLLYDGDIQEFNRKRDQLPANLLNFSYANLRGKKLSKVNLSNVNMSRADLSNADLDKANLSNSNLFKVVLEGANLNEADFSGADLDSANVSNANLSKANLSKANLSNADLSKTNLFGAYLDQTKVIRTKFIESDISKALLGTNPLWGAILEEPKQPVDVREVKRAVDVREVKRAVDVREVKQTVDVREVKQL